METSTIKHTQDLIKSPNTESNPMNLVQFCGDLFKINFRCKNHNLDFQSIWADDLNALANYLVQETNLPIVICAYESPTLDGLRISSIQINNTTYKREYGSPIVFECECYLESIRATSLDSWVIVRNMLEDRLRFIAKNPTLV